MRGLKQYRRMSKRKQSLLGTRYRTRGKFSRLYKRYRRMQLQFEGIMGGPIVTIDHYEVANVQ